MALAWIIHERTGMSLEGVREGCGREKKTPIIGSGPASRPRSFRGARARPAAAALIGAGRDTRA
jgi:hypothetical protein